MNKAYTHWHSTNDPNGPSPDEVPGTFRDISLPMFEQAWIDQIDTTCQELEISRSDFLQRAAQVVVANKSLLTEPEVQLPTERFDLDDIK